MPEPGVREVSLFNGSAAPYGDARFNPARPNAIESTLHGMVAGGGFMPYFAATETAWAQDSFGHSGRPRLASLTEWENSNGDPIILAVLGNPGFNTWFGTYTVRINPDGSVSQDELLLTSHLPRISPGVSTLHSDGGTTSYFFVCFGTTADIRYRNVAGTWAAVTGSPAQASGLLSENGNLWAVVNGYQVCKWPAGISPITGDAGAAIDVGDASSPITGAGVLGQSLVVFVKPDGIYIYDIYTNRFENIWAGLDANRHPDTGKGTHTWGNELFVPLGWGGMVRIMPNLDIFPASPLFGAQPDVRTPGNQRVIAMAGEAQYLYASLETFAQRKSLTTNLAVRTTADDSAFNDRDSVSGDNDLATSFTLADLNPVSAAYIYVGEEERFGNIWFDIVVGIISDSDLATLEYFDGSAWQSIAFTDSTVDFNGSGVVLPDVRVPDDWAQTAVDGATRYWLRLGFSDIETTTEIREIRVGPDIAPLSGTNVAESGYDEAGFRTHIIRGYAAGSRMVWEDVASLAGDVSHALLFTQLQAVVNGRALLAGGSLAFQHLFIGSSGEPDQERYPNCVNGFGSLIRLPARDWVAQDQSAPTLVKQIAYLKLFSRDFEDGADRVQAWVEYDGRTATKLGEAIAMPNGVAILDIPPAQSGRGYEYAVTVALEDANRGDRVPRITNVVAGVRVVSGQRA